jgi:molybdate transport system substrate-binding protein
MAGTAGLAGPRAAASAPQAGGNACGTVTVAAASDLTFAMNEIVANFEKASGCAVRLSLGSSGNFLTQIENGAPFDVFFSADVAYPKKLEGEGLAAPGSTYVYAIGKIVLWTRNGSGVDVGRGFAVLRDPSLKKLAIANPEHAPYGRAAEEALRHAGVYESVKDRIVLGENISQTAEFAESGNADAGIIALSLTASPTMKDKGRAWVIPENLYTPIEQGAVVVPAAANPPGARRFLEYVKMPATSALLERYGFILPGKTPGKGKP